MGVLLRKRSEVQARTICRVVDGGHISVILVLLFDPGSRIGTHVSILRSGRYDPWPDLLQMEPQIQEGLYTATTQILVTSADLSGKRRKRHLRRFNRYMNVLFRLCRSFWLHDGPFRFPSVYFGGLKTQRPQDRVK